MGWLKKIAKSAIGGIGLGGGLDGLRGEGSGRYRGELKALLEREREANRLYGDQAQAQLEAGLKGTEAGYNQALERTSQISRSARRDAITQGEKDQATLVQRLGAGGKFGTTALDNARMGLHSSLTRDLESIDSGFAELLSSLAVGKGAALASGRGALAALAQGRAAQDVATLRGMKDTIRPPRPGALSGIGAAAGAGLGYFLGGPMGAGIGGELGGGLGGSFERA